MTRADVTELPDFRGVFLGFVSERGAFVPDEPGRWAGWLLRHHGKRVTVTVSREKRRRSAQANRYYWGVVVPLLANGTGYFNDEAHAILKAMFLKQEWTLPNGKVVEVVGSTAELDTVAFAEYVNRCVAWIEDPDKGMGWHVPQPGEQVGV